MLAVDTRSPTYSSVEQPAELSVTDVQEALPPGPAEADAGVLAGRRTEGPRVGS